MWRGWAGCGTRPPHRRRSFFESSASAQVADVSQPLSVGCPHCKGDHQQLFENCIRFCPWLYVGHHGRLDYGRSGFLLPCLSREPNSQTSKNFTLQHPSNRILDFGEYTLHSNFSEYTLHSEFGEYTLHSEFGEYTLHSKFGEYTLHPVLPSLPAVLFLSPTPLPRQGKIQEQERGVLFGNTESKVHDDPKPDEKTPFLTERRAKRVYNPQLMAAKHISTGKRFCAPLPIIFSARKQINTSARLFSWGPTLLNNSLGGNSVYRWDSVS